MPQGAYSQEGPGGKLGCGLEEIAFSGLFLSASPASSKAAWLSVSSYSAFLHLPLVVARAHSGAHLLGDQGRSHSLPIAPSFQHESLFYSLLQSIQTSSDAAPWVPAHCCLLMFTILWDSTAPGTHTVSQRYAQVTLLESPLAQGSKQSRHRIVSPTTKPGVGSRASW